MRSDLLIDTWTDLYVIEAVSSSTYLAGASVYLWELVSSLFLSSDHGFDKAGMIRA